MRCKKSNKECIQAEPPPISSQNSFTSVNDVHPNPIALDQTNAVPTNDTQEEGMERQRNTEFDERGFD
jgi:hypothetical protein